MDTNAVRAYLLGLQQRIVDALQQADGKTFHTDGWVRAPGERLQGDGCRSWSKRAICWSAAAATSAM
jgi:coproporphyrinogen III oxidase